MAEILTNESEGAQMKILTPPAGVQVDQHTSGDRPALVLDHDGNGWSAVPHGALLPREAISAEGPWMSDNLVRMSRRSMGMDQLARFTVDGAWELMGQLGAAIEKVDPTHARMVTDESKYLEEQAARSPLQRLWDSARWASPEEIPAPALGQLVTMAHALINARGEGDLKLYLETGSWTAELGIGPLAESERRRYVGTGDTAEDALKQALSDAGDVA